MAASLAPTDFGRAVAGAVRTHPLLGGDAARIAAAQAQLAGARSRLWPRLSVGLDASLGLAGLGSGTSQGLPVVQMSQLLFDAGATRARVSAAQAGLLDRRIIREATAAQVAMTAVQAWHEVHYQRQLLVLADDNLGVHQDFMTQVNDRLAAGAGTQSDRLTAQSRLATAMARQVSVQSALERAEARWREVFGTPAPATLTQPPAAPALPQGADAELIETSPRVRSLGAQIEAAKAVVVAQQAARWPSVTLDLLGQRDLDAGTTSAEAQVRPRVDLANGGQRAAVIAQAEADLAQLRASDAEMRRQITRALETLRSDARTGQVRLETARAALDANQKNVAAAKEQFAIGRSTIASLLDAQRDTFDAAQLLAQAEIDLALSGYTALALTGDIVDVFGIILPDVLPVAVPAGALQPTTDATDPA